MVVSPVYTNKVETIVLTMVHDVYTQVLFLDWLCVTHAHHGFNFWGHVTIIKNGIRLLSMSSIYTLLV